MKNTHSIFLLLAVFTLTTAGKCRKDETPLQQLPPETQTGANTFGCLVNGQVFKPGGAELNGGSLNCAYQDLGTATNGRFYFVLLAQYRNNNDGSGASVGLFTENLPIKEGIKLKLEKRVEGKAAASYLSYTATTPLQKYQTDGNIYSGELHISKLDTIYQIISGTFWFDAVDGDGQKVEVREGRFDVRYTR